MRGTLALDVDSVSQPTCTLTNLRVRMEPLRSITRFHWPGVGQMQFRTFRYCAYRAMTARQMPMANLAR